MATASQRVLEIIEMLSRRPEGAPLGEISQELSIPLSATHRLLAELQESGYVRRAEGNQNYAISMKIVTLALNHLAEVDLIVHARNVIDRLAKETQMLVRLAISDGERLVWVLQVQGRRSNIRYDPPMEYVVPLATTSNGQAWLMQMSDDKARALIESQDLEREGLGSEAPGTTEEVLQQIRVARVRGWAYVQNSNEEGIGALAVPIVHARHGVTTGTMSISGLREQFDGDGLETGIPKILAAAAELAELRLDFVPYLLTPNNPFQHIDI